MAAYAMHFTIGDGLRYLCRKKRPPFPKAALLQLFAAGSYAGGGVGGVTGFFSRCGARSTRLALCQARSFSGWRVYLLYMMASSSVISSFTLPSRSPMSLVFSTPSCVSP